MPYAALRRRALERNRGSSCEDKSDSKIGCHIAQGWLPLFLNYPQRSFHLRASPTNPATPVVFAVWSAHDVNFVRFAMLINVVGFVVIRQNALSPLPAPRSGAGSGGNVQNRRFSCRYLLTKYLFRRGYAAARRIHVIFRDALSHLKAMPATAQRRIHTKRVGLKNMWR